MCDRLAEVTTVMVTLQFGVLCGQKSGSICNVKHASLFVLCGTGIVYSLPLPWDDVYFGKLSRFLRYGAEKS